MKRIYSILFLLIAVIAVNATLKESQKQKHDQQKNHNKKPFGHWDGGHKASKLEHHAVKEVLKHAPHVLTHHEAKLQLDLGHGGGGGGAKKQLPSSRGASTFQDLKLQDILLEDKIHNKIQSHKSHGANQDTPTSNGHVHGTNNKVSSSAVHGYKNGGHLKPVSVPVHGGGGVGRYNGGRPDKKLDKKSPKKVLNSSKAKKYKRAKRLHKFIW